MAAALFSKSIVGVVLNYLADRERDVIRATNGAALVWGKKPSFVRVTYIIINRGTGDSL